MLVMCERWVGDGTDCHILTPSSFDHSSTSSSFCWAAQSGSWGPEPSVWRWLSLRHPVPNCDCNSNWTLPASDSNWLTQAVCGTWLYNFLMPTCIPWASHLHRIQSVHRSRWYSDIFDRMHLFLDWRLGRRSVCYTCLLSMVRLRFLFGLSVFCLHFPFFLWIFFCSNFLSLDLSVCRSCCLSFVRTLCFSFVLSFVFALFL